MKRHTQVTAVIALVSLVIMLIALGAGNHDSRSFEFAAIGFVLGLMMTVTSGTAWLVAIKFPSAKQLFYILAKLGLGFLYLAAFFAIALINSDF